MFNRICLAASVCFIMATGACAVDQADELAPSAERQGTAPATSENASELIQASAIGYCGVTQGRCPIYTMKCICGGQTWYSCDSINTPYKISC